MYLVIGNSPFSNHTECMGMHAQRVNMLVSWTSVYAFSFYKLVFFLFSDILFSLPFAKKHFFFLFLFPFDCQEVQT